MTKFYDAATFYVRFLYCQNLSREKDLGVVIETRNLRVFAELFFELGKISRISWKYFLDSKVFLVFLIFSLKGVMEKWTQERSWTFFVALTHYFVVVLFILEDFAKIISTTKLVMQIVHFADFKKSVKYEFGLTSKTRKNWTKRIKYISCKVFRSRRNMSPTIQYFSRKFN